MPPSTLCLLFKGRNTTYCTTLVSLNVYQMPDPSAVNITLVQGQKHNLMYSSCQFECISDVWSVCCQHHSCSRAETQLTVQLMSVQLYIRCLIRLLSTSLGIMPSMHTTSPPTCLCTKQAPPPLALPSFVSNTRFRCRSAGPPPADVREPHHRYSSQGQGQSDQLTGEGRQGGIGG